MTKPCEAAAQSATYGALTRALIRITRRVLRSSSASRPHQRWRNQACLGQIPAAAVAGIYQDHCAARQFRLVLDNAAKLGEGPSIENHTLLVPSPDPSANALGLEILPGKGTADAFGLRTDLLKTAMVHIRGQMHDAHIASGNARGGHRPPYGAWQAGRQIEASALRNQIRVTPLPRQQRPWALPGGQGKFHAAPEGGNTDVALIHPSAENAIVVSHAALEWKVGGTEFVYPVCIGCFRGRAHGHLRRQPKAFTDCILGQLREAKFSQLAMLPGLLADPITRRPGLPPESGRASAH